MDRLFVGMDVHKEKIVAVGLTRRDHIRWREEFDGWERPRLRKRIQTLSRSGEVESCYEAGHSGYGLARMLLEAGIPFRVVAPSLNPRCPGNRVKTNSQDEKELALALRSKTLTSSPMDRTRRNHNLELSYCWKSGGSNWSNRSASWRRRA